MVLSEQVWVRYLPSGTVLFPNWESIGSHFYVVQTRGDQPYHAKTNLLGRSSCDEGDALGIRPFSGQFSLPALKPTGCRRFNPVVAGEQFATFFSARWRSMQGCSLPGCTFCQWWLSTTETRKYTPTTTPIFTEIFLPSINHTGVVSYCRPKLLLKAAQTTIGSKPWVLSWYEWDEPHPKVYRQRSISAKQSGVRHILDDGVHKIRPYDTGFWSQPRPSKAAESQMAMVKTSIVLVVTHNGERLILLCWALFRNTIL